MSAELPLQLVHVQGEHLWLPCLKISVLSPVESSDK